MFLACVFGELAQGQYYCYVSHHPITNAPIYVGMGKGNRYRPKEHSQNVRYYLLLERHGGLNIKTDIFPCSSQEEAFQWEKQLISMLRSNGVDLYNMTEGGEGGDHCEETRKKLSRISSAAHSSRTPEDQALRSTRLRESLKEYNSLLSVEEKELLKAKNKAGHAKRTPEQIAASVAKVQQAKNSRTEEQKRAESATRSATLRLRHAEKTPEQKATTSRRRSESLRNRDPEEEALRGQRISAAKKLRNSLMSNDEKLERKQKIVAGMLKKSPEERRASALRAWATKKLKESQEK